MSAASPDVERLGHSRVAHRHTEATAAALAGPDPWRHVQAMYVVSEADAAAIRTLFEQDGEFAAALELRRRFPGIASNEQARDQVRTIAGWAPLPEAPRPVTRLHPIRHR
jgi:hypothetical protein